MKTHWVASEDPFRQSLGGVKRVVFSPPPELLHLFGWDSVRPDETVAIPALSQASTPPEVLEELQGMKRHSYSLSSDVFWSLFSGYEIGYHSWRWNNLKELIRSIEIHMEDGTFYSLEGAHRIPNLPLFLNPQYFLQRAKLDWRSLVNRRAPDFYNFVQFERFEVDEDCQKVVLLLFDILAWALVRQREIQDLEVVYVPFEKAAPKEQPRAGYPMRAIEFDQDAKLTATLKSLPAEMETGAFRIWKSQAAELLESSQRTRTLTAFPARKLAMIEELFNESKPRWLNTKIPTTMEEPIGPQRTERSVFPLQEAPTPSELEILGDSNWEPMRSFKVEGIPSIETRYQKLREILGEADVRLVGRKSVAATDLKPQIFVEDKIIEVTSHLAHPTREIRIRFARKSEPDHLQVFNLPKHLNPLLEMGKGGIGDFLFVDRKNVASRQIRFRQNDLMLLRHQGLGFFLLLEMISWLLGQEQIDGRRLINATDIKLFLAYAKEFTPGVLGKPKEEFEELFSVSARKYFEDFVHRLHGHLTADHEFHFYEGGIFESTNSRVQVLPFLKFVILFFSEISAGKFLSLSKSVFHDRFAEFIEGMTQPFVQDTQGNPRPTGYELVFREMSPALMPLLFDLGDQGHEVFWNGQPLALTENPFRFDFELNEGTTEGEGSWFDLHPKVFFNGEAVDPNEVKLQEGEGRYGYIEYQGKFYRIDKKQVPSYKSLTRFWKRIQGRDKLAQRSSLGAKIYRLPRSRTLELLSLRAQGIDIQGGPEWKRICDFFDRGLGNTPVNLSEKTMESLLPHQRSGVQWLSDLYELRLGAVLADEMGLGKTFQVLAFFESLLAKKPIGRCLIVVPTSLVYNWSQERDKFSAGLPFMIYQSSKQDVVRRELAANDSMILVTTYGMLAENQAFFTERPWNIVIFDEAQSLKNITSQRSVSARKLEAQFKACLTGTPMENNYLEYFSICDLVVPGCLGDVDEFRREFLAANVQPESVDFLRQVTKPLLLRRTKAQVQLHLPEKLIQQVPLTFEKNQKEIYKKMALSYSSQLGQMIEEQGEGKSQIAMLAALMRLRQICSDPRAVPGVVYKNTPAKIEHLIPSVQEHLEEGESVIIFTQFLSTLERIESEFKRLGIPHAMIQGKVNSRDRLTLIDSFQNSPEPSVMLMTLKTGGVGLNLTKASVVYHLEPWWNPAVENQATDRAHRMGQKKSVRVFNLVIQDSLEERMTELKLKKQKSFDRLFDPSEDMTIDANAKSSLTKDDFQELLRQAGDD